MPWSEITWSEISLLIYKSACGTHNPAYIPNPSLQHAVWPVYAPVNAAYIPNSVFLISFFFTFWDFSLPSHSRKGRRFLVPVSQPVRFEGAKIACFFNGRFVKRLGRFVSLRFPFIPARPPISASSSWLEQKEGFPKRIEAIFQNEIFEFKSMFVNVRSLCVRSRNPALRRVHSNLDTTVQDDASSPYLTKFVLYRAIDISAEKSNFGMFFHPVMDICVTNLLDHNSYRRKKWIPMKNKDPPSNWLDKTLSCHSAGFANTLNYFSKPSMSLRLVKI